MNMNTANKYLQAYNAAAAAEKRYSDALQTEYGIMASDIRYRHHLQTPAIQLLCVDLMIAGDKVRSALQAMRADGLTVDDAL